MYGAVTMRIVDVGVQLLGSDIVGRCCYHANCGCWGAAAGKREDAAVAMLFAAVGGRCWGARCSCGRCCCHAICICWGWMLGSETLLLPCYWVDVGERDGSATLLLPCNLQLLGVDVGERDVAADAAVAMLFASVGGRCWGARCICGRCCCHAICSCWG